MEEQPGECQSLNQMVVKKISEICRVVNQVKKKKNLQRVGVELPIIRWLRWEGTPGVCLVHLKAGPGWLGQQVEGPEPSFFPISSGLLKQQNLFFLTCYSAYCCKTCMTATYATHCWWQRVRRTSGRVKLPIHTIGSVSCQQTV